MIGGSVPNVEQDSQAFEIKSDDLNIQENRWKDELPIEVEIQGH